MTLEFHGFPKIPRLRRPVVITEKIDGTNAAVVIRPIALGEEVHVEQEKSVYTIYGTYAISAQSRKRIITPLDDNYGFARWVWENSERLVRELGEGLHFGEWWGKGIQRGYNVNNKRFSLFNVARWAETSFTTQDGVDVEPVPLLSEDEVFDTEAVEDVVRSLEINGSVAAPGYDRPEGVVVFHKAGNTLFKRLLENDELPKGVTE